MKQIYKKYITIIISFYTFWLVVLPLFFNCTTPFLCKLISNKTNYIINVEKPRLYLNVIPTINIQAKNIKIKEKNSNNNIQISKFNSTARLLPLLSGKVHINNINIENILSSFELNKTIEFDKENIINLKNTNIKIDTIKCSNCVLNFTQKHNATNVNYTIENFIFQRHNNSLYLNFLSVFDINNFKTVMNIDIQLPDNNNITKSKVNLNIQNFDANRFAIYFKDFLPKDIINVNGIINVKANNQNLQAEIKNFNIINKDKAKSIILPEILQLTSNFKVSNKLICLENFNINSKDLKVNLNGNISNYLDKALTLIDFNVQIDKAKASVFTKMLPPIILEEFNLYKLKSYPCEGDAIGNFSIKGDIIEPEINGDIFINNIILIKPIPNANGATVKLNFTGKYVNFDVNVAAGKDETVWVLGGVELYNVKYSDMRIWSTKNINLITAKEKVDPLHEILNFIIGPVPIMQISGTGNIDIKVKGNRQNPHVWGYLNFRDVTTNFNDIPDLVLNKAKALLTFDDQNAHFETKEGFVNNKPISIAGDCNLLGEFDFDVNTSNQEIGYLYKALETASMIDEVQQMLPKLDTKKGLVNLKLKVYGTIIDIEDILFNKNLFSKGTIELLGNNFGMQGIKISDTRGKIDFDGTNANANISAKIGSSNLSAEASIKNNTADAKIKIPRLNLIDLVPNTSPIKHNSKLLVDINAKYNGNITNVELDKIDAITRIIDGKLCNNFKINNGLITVKNGNVRISDLKGYDTISNGTFNTNLNVKNITKPNISGKINANNFELSSLNILNDILPKEYKLVEFNKGKINLSCNIINNKINAYTDLGGIVFKYLPLNLPIRIINGSLIIKNSNLNLNKINLLADDMPILIDGKIFDILDKKTFNLYLNSKPRQDFIDKYFNKNQIYPLKIKGDIVYSLILKGEKDNFDLKADIDMAKNSSIYHLGAIIGDIENAIVLNLDTKIIKQNILKIKEFSYDKIIPSLGTKQTRLNMLKAKGGIEILADDLIFDNLYIKTQNPTDARIFNIIFRKPNIKQGQFTSDLQFNGKLSDPKLIGDFHIFETNIPFLDTTMKNIAFKFKDKTIELSSKGEILGNDIKINSVMKNKLSIPYYVENADLYTDTLDLDYIVEKLKLSEVENYSTLASFEGLDLNSIIIKSLNLNANNIYFRNIEAKDFDANISYDKNQLLRVNNFRLNIANGNVLGSLHFNTKNNHSDLKLKAKDIDANALTYALFDLNNQIYGDLTGDISLACIGNSFDNCMKTLSGKTTFNVIKGRLPKLGSLEYLLKASNLVKGGITSISINNIIDIITPLKTGDFSSIYGVIDIKDGIANDIEIATKGKDLNLFITGNYNFSSAIAEMEVLGLLSKKISTMFGPLGNLSLNTLFNAIPGVDLSKDSKLLEQLNKIPGIEISSKEFRKFVAEIKGNINGEDYVTSFKWIN